MTFEQLIVQQRPHVDRVVQDLARRHYLASAEIEEFRAAVERALERNDYELLRAFDGRSTWETYLTTVVTRQFFQFQTALWGQWRPTATAIRLGSAGMLLEELVVRDRFSLDAAIQWMRAKHRVDVSRHKLLQFAELLHIGAAANASAATIAPVPAPDEEMRHALADALALISPDERLMLELRFRDHQPLTRIAAILKIDVRPLQRCIDTTLGVIRQSLLTQGMAPDQVEELLRSAEHERAGMYRRWWDLVLARASKETGGW